MVKKRRKNKYKITKKEIRFYIIAAITSIGMWFIVSFFKELISAKWENPFILLIIGVFILFGIAFFFAVEKK